RYLAARTAERALIEARSHRPDLLIVDLGLPDRDGSALIRAVRAESGVPIVVLSARTLEIEKIAALDAGADDYVTKPFSAAELLARVRSALRRVTQSGDRPPLLKLGSAVVDLGARSARNAEGALHLTPLEYRLLGALARGAGLVVPQRELINQAWGSERIG